MKATVIRRAEEDDLAAILGIYNDAVLNSSATFDVEPLTSDAHRRWFEEASAHPYAVLVAERGGEVLAWGCLHRFDPKPGYRFTTEDSVYVRAGDRGQGIGKAVLEGLIETATANGFRTVIARVTADNPVSVQLHRRLGFRTVGVERNVGYKFGRWLDVVMMQRPLLG